MEGDAGTSRLNPTDDEDVASQDVVTTELPAEESIDAPVTESDESVGAARTTRIGRGIALSVCLLLLALAAAAGLGGYFALKSHRASQAIAADEAVAVKAAKDCVTATQAPDTAAMIAAQTKIIECSTGGYGAQAAFMSGIMLDAYKAANATVQVTEMRAAVEKHNNDGSMDVLVAFRVKITNSTQKDKEVGYRMRAQMAPADGTYKVAKLDQVTS